MEIAIIMKAGVIVKMAHFEFYHEAMQWAIDFFRTHGTDGYTFFNPTFYCRDTNEEIGPADIISLPASTFMHQVGG